MPRLALAALLALAPTAALADIGEDEFTPVHLQQLVGLEDFSYDTDWFPMDAALQLRLIAHAGNSVTIKMPGQAVYDWTNENISFLGDPDAGTFDLDIGLELDAKIRFDVLGQQWESDIIGPYDYAVISGATYTPYLLFENPDRPLEIDDQTDPITFVSVPVTPDIIIASGHLDIDAYVIVAASLECVQIEAATPEQLAVITVESAAKPLTAPLDQDPFTPDSTLVCLLKTAPTIVLKPTLVMTILGQDFEIADIEIPIDLPPFDDTIRFDPITLTFPRPPAPPPSDSDSDSDGDTDSGDPGDSDTPTSGDDEPTTSPTTTNTSTDATTPDDPGADDDDGCNCRSTAASPLALLLLLALPRRRRSTLAACAPGPRSSSRP